MKRFEIEGRWYDADTYKDAREQHQAWKSGGAAASASGSTTTSSAASTVATKPAIGSPKPVVGPKPPALRGNPVGARAADPTPAPTLAPAATAIGGLASELKLYRGDARPPDVIARDGFQLWGDAVAGVSAAGGIAEFILHRIYLAYGNERDIERYIVTAKDRARPTISTSRNDGCGGYDGGNIYRIEYTANELQEYPFDDAMKAYKPTLTGTKFPNFKLYMDRPEIKAARQIALDLNIATQEVVFFRHVPGNRITRYKPQNGTSFQAMPAAAAPTRLW